MAAAELRRTVSFRIESAPSSGKNGLEPPPRQPAVPRTAPVKSRPGILRISSSSIPAERSDNEILQISGHKLSNTTPPTKHTPPINSTSTITSHDTIRNAAELRLATSHKMHEEVKSFRYETSKIRETLLKIEEEVRTKSCHFNCYSCVYVSTQIKHTLRTKESLETYIQDIRAGISTNQQSVSIQEKRSRDEVCSHS